MYENDSCEHCFQSVEANYLCVHITLCLCRVDLSFKQKETIVCFTSLNVSYTNFLIITLSILVIELVVRKLFEFLTQNVNAIQCHLATSRSMVISDVFSILTF